MAATNKVFVNDSAPQCEDVDLNGYKNENNNLIVFYCVLGKFRLFWLKFGVNDVTKAINIYRYQTFYIASSFSANKNIPITTFRLKQ